MKLKFSFIALICVIAVFLNSCSNDYSDNVANTLTSITLTADVSGTTVGVDQMLVFTVQGNNGTDYTELSQFYVNGTLLSDNTYQFTETGEFSFHAVYEGITSNTLDFTVVDQNYMTLSHTLGLRGQTITFNFFDVEGNDLTAETDFYVNNNLIDGNTFSTNDAGDYEVYAVYDGISSEAQNFTIFIPRKKVALDDYTGTWCGWCPRVLNIVDQVEDQTDDVVVIAIHVNDEMEFPQYQQLFDFFDINPALPRLYKDRGENVSVLQESDIPTAVQMFLDEAGSEVATSIAINTTLSGDNLGISVSLLSEENLTDSHKLVVYVYQDGLIYDQTNYYNNIEGSPWYQLGNPIPDFVHNHVLETSVTNLFGDAIDATPAYQVYTKTFSAVNLSQFAHTDNGNTFDPNKFGVIVYLVDENSNSINAQKVKAGQSIGFE